MTYKKFPRQKDGKGGWIIDYSYLEAIEIETAGLYAMEDIEAVLLAVEKLSESGGTGE